MAGYMGGWRLMKRIGPTSWRCLRRLLCPCRTALLDPKPVVLRTLPCGHTQTAIISNQGGLRFAVRSAFVVAKSWRETQWPVVLHNQRLSRSSATLAKPAASYCESLIRQSKSLHHPNLCKAHGTCQQVAPTPDSDHRGDGAEGHLRTDGPALVP